jgi:hypothetical protein
LLETGETAIRRGHGSAHVGFLMLYIMRENGDRRSESVEIGVLRVWKVVSHG